MTLRLVADTSVAVPLVLASHAAHAVVHRRLSNTEVALTEHSLAETYSVLTRLPGDARLTPADAARLLEATFLPRPVGVSPDTARRLPTVLAPLGIAGGAVYDALVGLAAVAASATLVTRDRRAATTYAALGARVELVGD